MRGSQLSAKLDIEVRLRRIFGDYTYCRDRKRSVRLRASYDTMGNTASRVTAQDK